MNKWKPTKFLILEHDNDYWDRDEFSKDVMEKVHYCDLTTMRVIECYHPTFAENVVTVEDKNGCPTDFVKDTRGILYTFDEYITKADLVQLFE